MAGLPLLKLSGLLVKTIAKPVATRLKIESVKHPNFQRVCKSIGQLAHQIASRVNVLGKELYFTLLSIHAYIDICINVCKLYQIIKSRQIGMVVYVCIN